MKEEETIAYKILAHMRKETTLAGLLKKLDDVGEASGGQVSEKGKANVRRQVGILVKRGFTEEEAVAIYLRDVIDPILFTADDGQHRPL